MAQKTTKAPSNQKAVYQEFSNLYSMIMNDDIEVEKASQACKALSGMNKTFALELKMAEIKKSKTPRKVES